VLVIQTINANQSRRVHGLGAHQGKSSTFVWVRQPGLSPALMHHFETLA